MPEIVTDFQPFENSKKPLKTIAHCDFAPRFLPTKIREEPFFEGRNPRCRLIFSALPRGAILLINAHNGLSKRYAI